MNAQPQHQSIPWVVGKLSNQKCKPHEFDRVRTEAEAIEIDNSAAERAVRGVAIALSNYLFACANSDGERVSTI